MRLDQKFQGSYSLSFHYLNYRNTNNLLRRPTPSPYLSRVSSGNVHECVKDLLFKVVFILNDIIDVYVKNELLA